MVSKKYLIIILSLFLFPVLVFSQAQDYLFVSGAFDGTVYTIDSIEQRVIAVNEVPLRSTGTYEIRLYKQNKVIDSNFFEISEPGWVGFIDENGYHGETTQKKTVFTVAVPLTASLDVAQGKLQLLKSGQVLVEKKLSELPVVILASQDNQLQTLERFNTGSSYLFHLYYDNGQLAADRDVQFKYDVIPETFVPETVNTQFPYKGEIINLNDRVAGTFVFDPRRGDPKFLKGKISIKAPYTPDGEKAVFYNNQGDALLTIFVSESSFCNDDGVCNTDNGEDENTCPADCKGVTPLPPITDDTGSGQGGVPMAFIYALIIAGSVLGGWFGWRRDKSRQEPPMPQYPPANLPPQQPVNPQ